MGNVAGWQIGLAAIAVLAVPVAAVRARARDAGRRSRANWPGSGRGPRSALIGVAAARELRRAGHRRARHALVLLDAGGAHHRAARPSCWRASCCPATRPRAALGQPGLRHGILGGLARRRRAADLCRVLRRHHAGRSAAGRRARAARARSSMQALRGRRTAGGVGARALADLRRRLVARPCGAAERRRHAASRATTNCCWPRSRPTLVRHFKAHGWRTVNWMPGLQKPWPEGSFYGFDRYADAEQHRLSRSAASATGAFPTRPRWRLLHAQELAEPPAQRAPRFIVFPTLASHAPFRPLAPYVPDWERLLRADAYTPAEVAQALAQPVSWLQPVPALPRIAGLHLPLAGRLPVGAARRGSC